MQLQFLSEKKKLLLLTIPLKEDNCPLKYSYSLNLTPVYKTHNKTTNYCIELFKLISILFCIEFCALLFLQRRVTCTQETLPEKANPELQGSAACSGNSSPCLQKGPLTCHAAEAARESVSFQQLNFH